MTDGVALPSNPASQLPRFGALALAIALALGLWLVVSIVFLFTFWHGVETSLGGPDDAMRLVEVRRLLAGQSYFDLFEPRLGLHGYLTHWSRLLDLGLAGTIKILAVFVGQDRAELLTRAFWPLPFLAMMMIAQVTIAFRLGGRHAAMLAALLAGTCLPGFAHFAPGAIDHHNVQATLCALTIALMVRGLSSVRAAAGAGAVAALTLGVGLEALALIGTGAAVMALAFVRDGTRARQVRAFALSLAAAGVAVFAITVAPARWSTTACDAFAINTAALVVLAAAGLAAATASAADTMRIRLAATIIAAAVAVAVYLALDPACPTGPFAHVDPALKPLWLNHVTELRSIVELAMVAPASAVFYAAFPLLGIVAAIALLRRAQPPELILVSAVFALGCIIAAIMVRAEVYPNWFAVPLVATALAQWLDRRPDWSALQRAGLIVLALPLTAGTMALLTLPGSAEGAVAQARREAAPACFDNASYQALARLPPGLVLSQLDIAAHVLALTPHRVVMGPYHRLDRDVLFALRLFAGPVEAAAAQLRANGIDYIVDCAALELTAAGAAPSFRAALIGGQAPAFLQPIAAGDGSPLLIWRVKR